MTAADRPAPPVEPASSWLDKLANAAARAHGLPEPVPSVEPSTTATLFDRLKRTDEQECADLAAQHEPEWQEIRDQFGPCPPWIVERIGDLIGAGMESHRLPHECDPAHDETCHDCWAAGQRIAPVVADIVFPFMAQHAVAARPGCGCDNDPIECNHQAAFGEADAKLHQAKDTIRIALEELAVGHVREAESLLRGAL